MGPIQPTSDGINVNPANAPADKFKIFEIFILLLLSECAHDIINHVPVLDNIVTAVTVNELIVIPSIRILEPML